jgi:hypothetical protein
MSTDYSKMSDFEINKCVALIVNPALAEMECYDISSRAVFHDKSGTCGFSFISDPADAWPIISDSRISICFDQTIPEYEGEFKQWCCAISPCQNYQAQYQSNPLRAAMIVFLMMQESKNAS